MLGGLSENIKLTNAKKNKNQNFMKTLSGNLTIKKTSISLTLLYLPSMFKLIQ